MTRTTSKPTSDASLVVTSEAPLPSSVEESALALAVEEGIKDANSGRVLSHASLKRELANRYGR